MNWKRSKFVVLLLAILPLCLSAQQRPPSEYGKEQRMAWWTDARFGMFIHWGPDAVPSLKWKGVYWNESTPRSENDPAIRYPAHESMLHIPKADWENEVIAKFNPTAYDPEKWVKAGKNAGMKYAVLTTKHHNGFLMWPGLPGYDIRSTKFSADPVAMFVDACRKHDMKVGFYYSQLDWHDPDAMGDHTAKTYPDGWISNPEVFIPRIKSQIKDLLTKYGKIDLLWFDGGWIDDWTLEMGVELETFIRNIQPDIIINDRIGKSNADGDYFTPEQFIPPSGIPGAYWEACMTMNDTWFYVEQDDQWKTSNALIQYLIDAASKGGNYLLNVGPDALGRIPKESAFRLDTIGAWMQANGEAIYGTEASPFDVSFNWGRVTKKGTTLYLHLFETPGEGQISLPLGGYNVRSAYLLADRKTRASVSKRDGGEVLIELPEPINTDLPVVIKVEYDEPLGV